MTGLRLVAFGDLGTETWGVSAIIEGSQGAHLAVRAGPAAGILEIELEPADAGWQLRGAGASLTVSPVTASVASRDAESQLRRRDQLCQINGSLQLDGEAVELDCLGWRSSAEHDAGLDDFESLRFLAAWFDAKDGFSLTALRPRRTRGHEADVIAAALVAEPASRVVDPRLSTTYSDAGVPARAGLELWLEPEGEAASEDAPVQHTRRAAGETEGAGLDWTEGEIALHASLLRWHSHGRHGPGVYVLGQWR